MSLYTDLRMILPEEDIREKESLAPYTTFRCGGPCDLFLTPSDSKSLKQVMECLQKENTPWFLLGRGSNVLISDDGFKGAVISLKKHWNQITVSGTEICADGGVMMADIAAAAANAGLTGFEFASGIPGTIGGGIMMNAGAYGSDLSQVICEAEVLLPDGEIRTFSNEELKLSYRHSVLKENGGIVLKTKIALSEGKPEEIREYMAELQKKRRDKQPLEYPSAGSTFKRPEGYYAGALIEECGLKGYRYKNAGVSAKHAGFVISYGDASADEIYTVICRVIRTVEEKTGVHLEPEVIMLGEFREEK